GMPEIERLRVNIREPGRGTVPHEAPLHLGDHRTDAIPRKNVELAAGPFADLANALNGVARLVLDHTHGGYLLEHADDKIDAHVAGALHEQRKGGRFADRLVVFKNRVIVRLVRRQRYDCFRAVTRRVFSVFDGVSDLAVFRLDADDERGFAAFTSR